jgi:hypothetical protein
LQFPESSELAIGLIDLQSAPLEFKLPPPEWSALAESLLHRPAPIIATGAAGATGAGSLSSLTALQNAAGQGSQSLPFLKTCEPSLH